MALFALIYDYADNSDDARDTYRAEHRDFLRELAAQDKALVCGPWSDSGNPGALLIIRAESLSAAEELLKPDPFQREGLVARATFREWSPVLGPVAEHFA